MFACALCAAAGGREERPVAWDQRRELGTLRAFWRTSVQMLRSPGETLARAPADAPTSSSLLFAFLALLVGLLPSTLLLFALAVPNFLAFRVKAGDTGDGTPFLVGMFVSLAVGLVLFAAVWPLLGAALDHLGLRLVGARPQPYRVTLRAWALAQGPMLVGLVPLCGTYVHGIWTWVTRVMAYRALHRTGGGRAFAATLVGAMTALVLFLGPVVLIGVLVEAATSGSAVAAQAERAPDPRLPEGVIVRPTFDTQEGEFSAGTAFFLVLPGHDAPLGLTAHHLFGPSGGLEKEVSARELGAFVEAVYLQELDGEQVHEAGDMLVLPSAGHAGGSEDWSSDLAAFHAPASFASRALPLAARNAEEGEEVWLVAELLGTEPPVPGRLHRARVVASSSTELRYVFEAPGVVLRATSGAPVVNARGEVVGVNLGGGPDGDATLGIANPASSVRKHLERGLASAH